jgi:hypothetical protein
MDPGELAGRVKQDSEQRLIVASVTAGLRTGDQDDKLSTWALMVAGSIPALAWVNGELIRELANRPLGVLAIGLLAISGVAGILQRHLGHVVRINLIAASERQEVLASIMREQGERMALVLKRPAEKKLREIGELTDQDYLEGIAIFQSSKPDLGHVDREVDRNLQESQPGIIRLLGGKGRAKRLWDKWGPSWQLHYLTKMRARQSFLLALQVLALVAAIAVGGLALLAG